MSDTNSTTGAVRSNDANHLDFCSLPLIGLIGVARTASEGGTKYGRYNYMKGFPIYDLLNHSIRHIVMFILGDRTEPHLEHAAWGLLAAIQSNVLNPELNAPHMLGPGATLTPAVLGHLAEHEADLSQRRKAGEFANIGNWELFKLPEIQRLISQRGWAAIANRTIKSYVEEHEGFKKPKEVELPQAKAKTTLPDQNKQWYDKRANKEFGSQFNGGADITVDDEGFEILPTKQESFRVPTGTLVEACYGEQRKLVPLCIFLEGKNIRNPAPIWMDVVLIPAGTDPNTLLDPKFCKVRTLVVARTVWENAPVVR